LTANKSHVFPQWFMQRVARIESWFDRRCAALNSDAAWRKTLWIAPLVGGLLSLMLGQDDSWDMKNYHIYNPWALLNHRLDVDMAPAQWQSYFNPALDLVHHFLNAWMPAPLAGFVMGALQAMNVVLVMQIARLVLVQLPGPDQRRLPLLLAVAAMCSVGFLSQLGNSMGDNLSALFVLASLCWLLHGWEHLFRWSGRAFWLVAGAGLIMGLGAGLKLTNATYALALCLALLTLAASVWQRMRLAFIFGTGVLAGIAISAGYWFLKMWQMFGNPLFPQFNSIFRSPLALPSGVIDNFHMPQNWFEALTWPVFFTVHFERVSELVFRQLLWPLLYVLVLAVAAKLLWQRARFVMAGRTRFLLVFFVLAFLAWMKLFGIHRYLVPLELLGPLVCWLLFHSLWRQETARRIATWSIVFISVVVFPFGTWGHTPWASHNIRADLPAWPAPETGVVFTSLPHPPSGWMVKLLPPAVSVIAVGSGFPESAAYQARIASVVSARPGPHYLLVQASKNPEEGKLAKRQAVAEWFGMTSSAERCGQLDWLTRKVRLHVDVRAAQNHNAVCELALQAPFRVDLPAENQKILNRAGAVLENYGFRIDARTCGSHNAFIGAEPMPYLLCKVEALKK
jgi:hypothetical protein